MRAYIYIYIWLTGATNWFMAVEKKIKCSTSDHETKQNRIVPENTVKTNVRHL